MCIRDRPWGQRRSSNQSMWYSRSTSIITEPRPRRPFSNVVRASGCRSLPTCSCQSWRTVLYLISTDRLRCVRVKIRIEFEHYYLRLESQLSLVVITSSEFAEPWPFDAGLAFCPLRVKWCRGCDYINDHYGRIIFKRMFSDAI